MRYKLILLYDPFTYPQNFENYMNDMYLLDAIREEKLFEDFRLKYRNLIINHKLFEEIKNDVSLMIGTEYYKYLDLLTIFIVNSGFASYCEDRLMAYSDASRSFTDLCALAANYGIIKEHKEIIPFFQQLMELFDLDIIQAGYCTDVDKFVFFPTADQRNIGDNLLRFGDWVENKRDLLPEHEWPFVKPYNTDLIIQENEPEPIEEEDDDYWEDYEN